MLRNATLTFYFVVAIPCLQKPDGGMFGCIDTHAQMIVVDKQFHVILNSVRFVEVVVANSCRSLVALSKGMGMGMAVP